MPHARRDISVQERGRDEVGRDEQEGGMLGRSGGGDGVFLLRGKCILSDGGGGGRYELGSGHGKRRGRSRSFMIYSSR